MHENDVATTVVDAALTVHRRLGPGLLESVYEAVLAYELRRRGLAVRRQVEIGVTYDEVVLDLAFRADMIVEELVVLELKSVERLAPVHGKQLLTYLRLADKRLGLLLNFGAPLMKEGIHRVVNGLVAEPVGAEP